MTLQEVNEQLGIAQELYEKSVTAEKEAIDKKDTAMMELEKAKSSFMKARLDRSVYEKRVNTLQEQSRNIRAETKIK